MATRFSEALTEAFANAESVALAFDEVEGTARLLVSSVLTSGLAPGAPWVESVTTSTAVLNYPGPWTGTAVIVVLDET